MELTSLHFFVFISIVILLYFTLFRRWQSTLILLSSIIFYLFSGPQYILFILISSLSAWAIALQIQKIHGQEKEKSAGSELSREERQTLKAQFKKKRSRWLKAFLILNLGILGVIKYTDYVLHELAGLHLPIQLPEDGTLAFVLPLGISFYTFMLTGYVLDVFWKRYQADKSYRNVLLFAIYFPHITQGPISRYNKLTPQLTADHPFDYDRVMKGAQLLLWGLFEKLVIADRLAIFCGGVYDSWKKLPAMPLIIALIFFSIRLYMDFQGCMDIGRGISQIFGIDLELNFNHPYFSRNMPEFWRRWHITLGAWFKDYLLYPVSMSSLCKNLNRYTRKKWGKQVSRVIATIIPTVCVWLITGIWHGAARRYIAWGIYHGILVIASTALEVPVADWNKKHGIDTEWFSYRLFQMVRTFILSAIGRLFFFGSSIHEAAAMFKHMIDVSDFGWYTLFDKSLLGFGLDQGNYQLIWLLIFLLWGIGMAQERGIVIRDWIGSQHLIIRWSLYLLLIASLLVFGIYGKGFVATNFVYGGF